MAYEKCYGCSLFCSLWSFCGVVILIFIGILIRADDYAMHRMFEGFDNYTSTKSRACFIGAGIYGVIMLLCLVIAFAIRAVSNKRS